MFSTGSTAVEGSSDIVAFVADDKRHRFLSLVYLHLAGATLGTILLVGSLLRIGLSNALQYRLIRFEHIVLAGCIVSTLGVAAAVRLWAVHKHSLCLGRQYALLFAAVAAISTVIWPAIQLAQTHEANLPRNLAVMSAIVVGGLALSHGFAGRGWPWYVRYLVTLVLTALAMLVVLTVFGQTLRLQLWLPAAMIAAAATAIQYEITDVVHACRTDEYVLAAAVLCGFGTLLAVLTLTWMLAVI